MDGWMNGLSFIHSALKRVFLPYLLTFSSFASSGFFAFIFCFARRFSESCFSMVRLLATDIVYLGFWILERGVLRKGGDFFWFGRVD
jgi:hypothetical protein